MVSTPAAEHSICAIVVFGDGTLSVLLKNDVRCDRTELMPSGWRPLGNRPAQRRE
jgi:hypothetical protein